MQNNKIDNSISEKKQRDRPDNRKRNNTKRNRKNNYKQGHVYGVIDLGTNNCRLLVAVPSPGGFKVIDSFSRIVRLGEGLKEQKRISDQATERTVSALKICMDKMRRRVCHAHVECCDPGLP